MILKLTSFLGLLVFIGICYLLSTDRKAIKWKTVLVGCLLQFSFAFLILKTPIGHMVFDKARSFFQQIMNFSVTGAQFVFGPLADLSVTGQVFGAQHAFIFAIQVSCVIIFISSLMAILYHVGLMQRIVYGFAKVMQKLMNTSGTESLAAAANVFMGQTEAPLVVRPYLLTMTRSEIMAMMTGGMATVAGSVLAAYVSFGVDAGHLLAASVMSAPACLAIAKILVPETQVSETANSVPLDKKRTDTNVLDAACRGASEGLQLSLNVMAMLIAFIAIIALANYSLNWFCSFFTNEPITMQKILGYFCAPFAFLMGIPLKDCLDVGTLIGVKIILNEFVGYLQLREMQPYLDPRSTVIATYALCGFANFSSVAIQIGGIGALVPERRKDLAKYGLLAMVGGIFAAFMTAAIAGIFI